jgi:hypothetical protein
VLQRVSIVDEILRMTFPDLYNRNALSKSESLMLSAKTIKAPITYKALIGGGANNSD